ncbi:DUF402 domain-containing protein [Infirmifilum lucidum]|uniref:DUF402 domain-containing protein n=1 Tax=Infirmifilum lucidum TaxID=2776706 RepID=A0A7L9FET2_9CREN|nr:DUF402 domain-containing protein [Infirmifilum lucidum]QOJ78197.1 DUF402 domain-containing protein [Infirmifilum lucidum]
MIRVRGIFATAIAGLLDSSGYTFSDVSEQLLKRLGSLRISREGVRVTVKDLDSRKGVLIVGERDVALQVLSLVKACMGGVGVVVVQGPYTLYRARVSEKTEGGYIVELPGARRGYLRTKRMHGIGGLVTAHVVRPDPILPVLEEGVAVTGRYARVIEGSVHSVSEHIKDGEFTLELLSLASQLAPEGWGVRFRSAAKSASILEVMEELRRLLEEARKLKDFALNVHEPTLVKEGEAIIFLHFEPENMFVADSLRSRFHPTLEGHHLIKSLGDNLMSDKLDSLEEKGILSEDTLDWYARGLLSILSGRSVRIIHDKPFGRGFVWHASARVNSDGFVYLERSITSNGYYDGLGVKKEAGDKILTVTYPFSRFLAHYYFSASGSLKGVYINLNLPLDYVLSPPALWYLDVFLDVVWTREGRVGLIDVEEYEALKALDAYPNEKLGKYREAAEALTSVLLKDPEYPLKNPQFLVDLQKEIWGDSEKYSRSLLDKIRAVVGVGRPVGSMEDEVH